MPIRLMFISSGGILFCSYLIWCSHGNSDFTKMMLMGEAKELAKRGIYKDENEALKALLNRFKLGGIIGIGWIIFLNILHFSSK